MDLDQLARDLAELAFVPGTDTATQDARRLARCRRLLDVKLRFEARRGPEASPIVAVAGGTNVGKSTVFNWLAQESISRSSPLARFTKWPAVYAHDSERAALADGAFLPGYRKLVLERPEQLAEDDDGLRVFVRWHDRGDARGVVLVDSPDIDSTHERNRVVAQDLLDLADAIVFVATPEKYNDEVCVEYLREAARIGKRLIAVMNKSAEPEVLEDFTRVVHALVPAEHRRDCHVFAIPYVPKPGPDAAGPWRDTLRTEAAAPGKAGVAVRERALRGTRTRLARELREVTGRLREELSVLDRLRADADARIAHAVEGYRGFLSSLDFYELDQVYERIIEHFRIPVIDDVYGGMRKAATAVTDAVSRTVTGRQEEDARTVKLRERRERDRAKAKELFEEARAAVAKLPEGVTGPLAKVRQGWAPPPPTLDQVNGDIERFLQRADEDTERWVDEQTRAHVQFFKAHPYLKATLRVMKGTFQIGFGLVSAYLTGGLLHGGPIEGAVSGILTERAIKIVVDNMGGFMHYQTLKSDYTRARAELFRATLEASVRRPFLERLPEGPSPERLVRVDEAARQLEREGA